MLRTLPRLHVLGRRSQPARSVRRRAGPAVVVGLLLIAAANAALGVAAERYPRLRDPVYGDKAARLRSLPAAGPRVVILGTSRANFAFHGLRIEDRVRAAGSSVTAFNFGVPASGPVTHLLYARRLIRDGLTPDLLFVEILPSMLADLPDGPLEHRWLAGDRLTYRELDTAITFGFDAAATRRQWRQATLTPWYGLRLQLLGRVLQSWLPWHVRYDWGRTADARGWSTPPVEEITAEQRTEATAGARKEYAAVLYTLRPAGPAADALRTLLRECREQGVPVELVLMPESTAFRSWYPPVVQERLTAFVRGACAEFGCEAIDARGWLPDEAFTDGHHPMRPGAEAFSDRLTDDAILPWLANRARKP